MKNKQESLTRELNEIESIVNSSATPLTRKEIASALTFELNEKTLQRRLKALVSSGVITTTGKLSGLKYHPSQDSDTSAAKVELVESPKTSPVLSQKSLEMLKLLDAPSYTRQKVSYDPSLIQNYEPNVTRYVPEHLAERLYSLGKRFDKRLAAGTYAKDITQRLLIDLSFNSSRLEGNTYSILDTERLIEGGVEASGKHTEETIMILNHKEVILFLVENAEELTLSPFVVYNIHGMLSQELLSSPSACGRIRQVEVKITKTSYVPLSTPQQLEECFSLLLIKASKIKDPFEQAFFLLMHISYLQAFEDVNKRTARMTCNLPFIKDNLCPLSFVDVPKDDYVKSLIYFYETGDYTPALDVFVWAYERSSQQYKVVEESMGTIDLYRIKYRKARKSIMGSIIKEMITDETQIMEELESYCQLNDIEDPDRFAAITSAELSSLHIGSIVSLGVTQSCFENWKARYDAIRSL
ncbi:Fic family protein [Vibrio crassostreae]|uniref:Fic family protein n=1 Tax=Vibrio crassostreae TaxID=246167 RepID=UPI001B30B08D|nr:Fic family protein [Vibrio crassostreae]